MKRIITLLAAVCVLLCGVTVVASAEADPVIARFEFANTDAVAETNIELNGYGDKDKGYNSTFGDAELYASVNGADYRKLEWTKDNYSERGMQPAMTGGNKHPWAEGAFFEVQVPTVGFENITFSAEIGATKKGPRDYQLQYSLDGKTYQNVGEVKSLSDNKTMEPLFDNVVLPAEAAQADMLYIRMTVASDQTVGGEVTLYGSTGGDAAINNIVVGGTSAEAPVNEEPQQGGNGLVWVAVGAGVLLVAAVAAVVVLTAKKKK